VAVVAGAGALWVSGAVVAAVLLVLLALVVWSVGR
jgi:hypothetical protein